MRFEKKKEFDLFFEENKKRTKFGKSNENYSKSL